MRPTLRRLALLPLAAALVAAGGCTKVYHYELSGVVKNPADDKPLPGVKVVLNTFGHKDDTFQDEIAGQSTDEGGGFAYKFYVHLNAFDSGQPRWYLKLEKEGFVPDAIDIKPPSKPKEAGSTTPLVVVVYMRPKEQAR